MVGNSGSGKSALARALERRLGLPWIELDAIHHEPGWTALDDASFRGRVGSLVAGPRWVVDGNYRQVRDLVWARADTVIWLDLPRRVVVRRVVWRTVRRAATRQELWNGNRERLRDVLSWEPERSIVRWSWTRHTAYRERYQAAMRDPAHAHLSFVRLRSARQVGRFLEGLPAAPG